MVPSMVSLKRTACPAHAWQQPTPEGSSTNHGHNTELYFSWKIIFETKAKYENKNTWTTRVIYNQSKTTNFVVLLQSASV